MLPTLFAEVAHEYESSGNRAAATAPWAPMMVSILTGGNDVKLMVLGEGVREEE